MKKILLFVAATLFAMSASAQLYLRGDINSWGTGADWELKETESGVFELEKSFTLSGTFKVADATWSDADNYGAGDVAEVTAGQSIAAVNGSSTNFNVPSGKAFAVSKVVFDKNALTLTVYAQEEELVDDFAYFLHGSFATEDWASVELTESNGVWSIDELVVALDASFGVKRTNNGIQDAWYWTVAGLGTDVSAAGTYQFGEEKTALEGGNPVIKAGTYSISFDPATLIMTVTPATSTDIEETDAEDVVVAAYDLLGRPVAADAEGYVILQYASGKAEKIFN